MKWGVLYGIGVGPGDPELITVKGARILSECRRVFVPKSPIAIQSLALTIASRYLGADACVQELVFPMTADPEELSGHWNESAREVAAALETGEDACFLTLGDPFLYSTYIYLLRALRTRAPGVEVVTVPGVPAFMAAAALTEFPVGEAKEPVTILPTADDLEGIRQSLKKAGTLVLMKIGKRLGEILNLLEEAGAIERSVFVARVGMKEQRVEPDLGKLRQEGPDAGYLSIILVHPGGGSSR